MSSNERDPRTDPEAGDVVRAGNTTRTVTETDGGNIYYRVNDKPDEKCCWISTWREWCKKRKAEVVRA